MSSARDVEYSKDIIEVGGDVYTMLLLGAPGKGKNSLTCRLYGLNPLDEDMPADFGFKPSHVNEGTSELEFGMGSWQGKPDLGKLRVINTPGLGNQDKDKDTKNMAAIGDILGKTPIHMIVVVSSVLDARIEEITAQQLDVVLNKLSPADWSRIHFVENSYKYGESAVRERRATLAQLLKKKSGEVTNRDFMQYKVRKYVTFLTELSNAGELQVSEEQLEVFSRHFYFLDTNHSSGDKGAEDAFTSFVRKAKNITEPLDMKAAAARELKDVHRATVEAEKKAEERRQEAEQHRNEAEQHRQEAARHEKEAADAKAAEGESSARAQEAEKKRQKAHEDAQAAEGRASHFENERNQFEKERNEAQASKEKRGSALGRILQEGADFLGLP